MTLIFLLNLAAARATICAPHFALDRINDAPAGELVRFRPVENFDPFRNLGAYDLEPGYPLLITNHGGLEISLGNRSFGDGERRAGLSYAVHALEHGPEVERYLVTQRALETDIHQLLIIVDRRIPGAHAYARIRRNHEHWSPWTLVATYGSVTPTSPPADLARALVGADGAGRGYWLRIDRTPEALMLEVRRSPDLAAPAWSRVPVDERVRRALAEGEFEQLDGAVFGDDDEDSETIVRFRVADWQLSMVMTDPDGRRRLVITDLRAQPSATSAAHPDSSSP